jgi:CheY-like chemotaxis protein
MDCAMPIMDGFEATRRIRALPIPAAQSLPIIAVTASVLESDQQHCLSAGMTGILHKPLGINQLKSKIGEFIKQDK